MFKKNLILGGVLVLLIISAYIYQGPFQEWQRKKSLPKNFLTKIKTEEINKIEISNQKSTTMLEKINNRWKIGGTKDFFVNDDMAKNLTESLQELTKTEFELVSSNKEKQNSFFSAEQNSNIKLYNDEGLKFEFLIGKMGPDFRSSYITKTDTKETYLAKTSLFVFHQPDWRDKVILKNNQENINKIRLQYNGKKLIVEKQVGVIKSEDDKKEGEESEEKTEVFWKSTEPKNIDIDQDKIKKVLNIMADLQAIAIPEQTFDNTGLEKNSIIIQVTGEGIDQTLMIGDANKDNQYYVKRGDSDNIYLINEDQKNILEEFK